MYMFTRENIKLSTWYKSYGLLSALVAIFNFTLLKKKSHKCGSGQYKNLTIGKVGA